MNLTKGNGQGVTSTLTAKTTYQTNDLDFATTGRRHPNGDYLVTSNGLRQVVLL